MPRDPTRVPPEVNREQLSFLTESPRTIPLDKVEGTGGQQGGRAPGKAAQRVRLKTVSRDAVISYLAELRDELDNLMVQLELAMESLNQQAVTCWCRAEAPPRCRSEQAWREEPPWLSEVPHPADLDK